MKGSVVIVFLALLVACGRNHSPDHEGAITAGQQFDRSGIYTLKDCSTQLKIEVKDRIIHFMLSDASGKTLFKSGRPEISAGHRWYMVADDSCTIWIHSSDIGIYRLRKSPPSDEYILFVAAGPLAGLPANAYIMNGDTLMHAPNE